MSAQRPGAEERGQRRWFGQLGSRGDRVAFVPGLVFGAAIGFLLIRGWETVSPWRVAVDREDAGVPHLSEPPARHEQDTQPVNGEAAIHPPPGSELIQRSRVQG
jgi:hypothetical protein